jgi:thymidylate synthase
MPEVIAEHNLSLAWGKAFLTVMDRSDRLLAPLTISINGFDNGRPAEDMRIRQALDNTLGHLGKYSSAVSALTIFPYKHWDREARPDCHDLSDWYLTQFLPRLKARDRLNMKGTYFERMIAFQGAKHRDGRDELVVKNQLQHIIEIWNRDRKNGTRPRQSALQVACFDPAKDHTGSTRSGFPCLQQVSFAYGDHSELAVNAYYPTQYIFDRAYGNYLGLCHLGHFMACEMGLQIARLNCFIAHPELGSVNKGALTELVAVVRDCLSIKSSEPNKKTI